MGEITRRIDFSINTLLEPATSQNVELLMAIKSFKNFKMLLPYIILSFKDYAVAVSASNIFTTREKRRLLI